MEAVVQSTGTQTPSSTTGREKKKKRETNQIR